MAKAIIINVNGRDSVHGVEDETAIAGPWDPATIGIGSGTNADFFPAIYTENFTPGGILGAFIGNWPDGAGGKFTAAKVNAGFIGNWVIEYQSQYNLANGTPGSSPSDGIVLSAVPNQAGIIVYENTEKRVEVGYLSAGVFGIKAYAADGSTPVFEASDTQTMLAGWDFTDDTLSSANISFVSGANPLITVGNDADWKIEIGGTAGSEYIGSSTFTSGPLGEGWQIDSTTGRAEFQDIVARGKITTAVYEYATLSAVGGHLIVSNADVLAVNMTALDASTLTIDGDATFSVDDILRIKDGVDDEWLRVTNVGSAPQYTVTRDLATDYAGDTNPIWTKGVAVVSTGTTGGGYIHMDSQSANSPYIDIVLRNSTTYNDLTTKVRLGNLDGIGDTDFGIAPSGFGLYTDNVFLKGSIVTSTGSGQRITINEYESGAFNNALIFYDGAGVVLRIDDDIVSGKPGIAIRDPSVGLNFTNILAEQLQVRSIGTFENINVLCEGEDAATGGAIIRASWIGVEAITSSTTNYGSSRVGIFGESQITVSGSTVDAVGLRGYGLTATGTSGDAIGIYASASVGGGSGSAYSIYAAAGDAYFADNVGIGTAAPNELLHLLADVPVLKIESSNANGEAWTMRSTYGGPANTGTIDFRDEGGQIWFGMQQNAGSPRIFLNPNGVTGLFIDSVGNVGIGDGSFGANGGQLRVLANASASVLTLFSYGNLADEAVAGTIDFDMQQTGTGGQTAASIRALSADTSEHAANLVFYTTANSGATEAGAGGTERVRIDENGNVGIGIAIPTALFHTRLAGSGVHWNLTRSGTVIADIGATSAGMTINALDGGFVTVNANLLNVDFVVAGDDGTHIIRTDAANNRLGISTSVPATTFQVVGATRLGDQATNYVSVESDGDVVFVGGGGLAFANFWHNSTETITITDASTPTEVRIPYSTIGVHNITAVGGPNVDMQVTYAGFYIVTWSISFTTQNANQEIEGGIMVNGAAVGSGQGHRRIGTATDTGSMSGSGLVDLSANDQISLFVENQSGTSNVIVEHVNFNAMQVGGT